MIKAREFSSVVEHSTAVREVSVSIPLTPFLKLLFRYTYIPIRNVNLIKMFIKACFVDVLRKKKEIEAKLCTKI